MQFPGDCYYIHLKKYKRQTWPHQKTIPHIFLSNVRADKYKGLHYHASIALFDTIEIKALIFFIKVMDNTCTCI